MNMFAITVLYLHSFFFVRNLYNLNVVFICRMTKKSWFGALMGNEREEHHFIMAQNKPLSQVKADLVHALLSVCV